MRNITERARSALEKASRGRWAANSIGEVGILSEADDQSFGMVCATIAVCEWPNRRENARLIALAPDLARLAIAADQLAERMVAILEICREPAETNDKNVRDWIEVEASNALTEFISAREAKSDGA